MLTGYDVIIAGRSAQRSAVQWGQENLQVGGGGGHHGSVFNVQSEKQKPGLCFLGAMRMCEDAERKEAWFAGVELSSPRIVGVATWR